MSKTCTVKYMFLLGIIEMNSYGYPEKNNVTGTTWDADIYYCVMCGEQEVIHHTYSNKKFNTIHYVLKDSRLYNCVQVYLITFQSGYS